MKRFKGEPMSSKSKRIVWDEANLEENERIKKTLSTVKINEPKTPYYGAISEDHEMMSEDLQPLELGNGALLQEAAGILQQGVAEHQYRVSGSSDHDASEYSHRPSSSFSSGFSSDGELQDDGESKRRRFEQHRRQHYNMRQAMLRAKQMLDTDEDANEQAGKAGAEEDERTGEISDENEGEAAGDGETDGKGACVEGVGGRVEKVVNGGRQEEQQQQQQQQQQSMVIDQQDVGKGL